MELVTQLSTTTVVVILIVLTLLRGALSVAEREARAPRPRARAFGEVLEALIIAMVTVFLVVRPFFLQAFYIPSESMRPTLTENDRILVNKLVYRVRCPHRHDVVVFRAPRDADPDDPTGEEKDFVKRIVGLPGDTVEVRGGTVYVNEHPDQEAFNPEMPDYDMPPYTVPHGKYFVMGDNRNHSSDSRRWGPLDADRLIGRAVVIFWPPARAGVIH